jgi:hypothetical protein
MSRGENDVAVKIFQKTLEDVIKLFRSYRGDTSLYVNNVINELKTELRSKDANVRYNAIRKLFFVSNCPDNVEETA